jgi:hypothetical protein
MTISPVTPWSDAILYSCGNGTVVNMVNATIVLKFESLLTERSISFCECRITIIFSFSGTITILKNTILLFNYCCFLVWLYFCPWWWEQYSHLKYQYTSATAYCLNLEDCSLYSHHCENSKFNSTWILYLPDIIDLCNLNCWYLHPVARVFNRVK